MPGLDRVGPADAPVTSLSGEPLPLFARAPASPLGPSPARRPGAVRRTMTLDAVWPDGWHGPTEIFGHARDILTPMADGAPSTIAEDRVHILSRNRSILSVETVPPRAGLDGLVGARAGSHLRTALLETMAAERLAGSPLYLMLDDFAGVSLVAGWTFSRWPGSRPDASVAEREASTARMSGVCIGYRPGSSGLDMLRPRTSNATAVPPLVRSDDPDGWHPLVDRGGMNFRRARYIDIWRDGAGFAIQAGFQDTASNPAGGDRLAIHEYRVNATMDSQGRLLRADATPGVLPLAECPAAPVNLPALTGLDMRALRDDVPVILRKTAGCTHLNDAMRALAEAPLLAQYVDTA